MTTLLLLLMGRSCGHVVENIARGTGSLRNDGHGATLSRGHENIGQVRLLSMVLLLLLLLLSKGSGHQPGLWIGHR